MLTIAIPSFNRNAKLVANVALLLPQLDAGCQLVVYDNCSDVPLATSLHNAGLAHPLMRVVRHGANIGGNANIIRCYECCETEWLWVLGDDDPVAPDAVERIRREIAAADETILHLSFRADNRPVERTERFDLAGEEGFLLGVDCLHFVLLISANVIRAPRIKPQLMYAYQYLYSCAPHLVALLFALKKTPDAKVRCLPERIVQTEPTAPAASWSMLQVDLGMPVVMELPMSVRARRALATKMRVGDTQVLRYGLAAILAGEETGDWNTPRLLFDHYSYRFLYGSWSGFARMQWMVCKMLLMLGGGGAKLVRLILRLAGKHDSRVTRGVNRFARL